MPFKTLCTIAITLFISSYSQAFGVFIPPNYEAVYNSSKTHYYVHLKDVDEKHPGYTAVFDATAGELSFKIPEYLGKSSLFLSNDGKFLASMKTDFQENGSYVLRVFDASGQKSSISLTSKSFKYFFGFTCESDQIKFHFRDSIYSVSIKDWTTHSQVNKETYPEHTFSNWPEMSDSIFRISCLSFNGLTLGEHLEKDLDVQNETIDIYLVIDSKGAILQLEIMNFSTITHKAGAPDTKSKIRKLLESYPLNNANPHKDVDFWAYKGSINLSE